MALPQSAVSELLEAFRTGEGVDLIRESARMVMQELIEAEATERIGAAKYERTESRTAERKPEPVTLSCASPSCARVRASRSSRTPPAHRPGLLCGSDTGLRLWRLDPVGRRPGRRPRHRLRYLQFPGVEDLLRPRRSRHRLPDLAAPAAVRRGRQCLGGSPGWGDGSDAKRRHVGSAYRPAV